MTDILARTLAEEVAEQEKWAELGRGVIALADELGLLPEQEQPKLRRRRRRAKGTSEVDVPVTVTTG